MIVILVHYCLWYLIPDKKGQGRVCVFHFTRTNFRTGVISFYEIQHPYHYLRCLQRFQLGRLNCMPTQEPPSSGSYVHLVSKRQTLDGTPVKITCILCQNFKNKNAAAIKLLMNYNYGCMGSPALKAQAASPDIQPLTPFSKDH